MERQNAAHSESAEQFRSAYPELGNPSARSGGALGASAKERHRNVLEAWRRVRAQGFDIVTVVNLHAFQLDLNMGALGHLTIPGKKLGEQYALKVLDEPRMAMKDNGDAKFEPIPVFPKEMALDIVNYYKETGGVFFFLGNGKPPVDMLEAAAEAQMKWYWGLFNEGNANWAQYNRNPRHISQRMRDAAIALFNARLINAKPEWVVISKQESPDQPCEGCGNVIAKIAKFCPTCHTIYDADWVKARRPDLWKAQNPADEVVSSTRGAAGSGTDAGISSLIKEEQKVPQELKPGPKKAQ